MYSNNQGYSNTRPPRNEYAPMDSPSYGGAAGGYPANNQYSNNQYAGHQGGQTADDLWAMDGGNSHRQYASEEKAPKSSSGKKKWIWIGIIALLVCIGAGVGAGVGITQANKNNSSGGGAAKSSGGGSAAKFEKDPRLHQVFWGLAYSPKDSIYPNCWANLSTVTKDIQLLSQLTTRLRLYGAMCDQTALVMQAIKDTGVDMKIYPAIYIDQNTEAYQIQVDALKDAFTTYGVDNVEGVAVGNEFILINITAAKAPTAPTGPAYEKALDYLSYYIKDFRDQMGTWGLSKDIKVGTGDAGALMGPELAERVDYFMANVHPWFAGTTVQDGAWWTYDYFMNNDVIYAENSTRKPDMYIAETGWPTGSSPPTSMSGDTRAPTDATVANLQIFLDEYVCQANANGTKYFYFEPFDEEWKDIAYGGVEGYWGLFDKNRNLKDITIPTCQ